MKIPAVVLSLTGYVIGLKAADPATWIAHVLVILSEIGSALFHAVYSQPDG